MILMIFHKRFSSGLVKGLKIYPFSLIIYLPEMADDSSGKTPVYVKILPRGDISAIRAQFSSLELLSVCYEIYSFSTFHF
jgi:hypothetical protein